MIQKPIHRTVFLDRYRDYMTIAEIAENHSFSENKVKLVLLRMRKQLKKYLQQEGISV